MPAQNTMLSPQQLIDAAKAVILGYNEKNWAATRASITSDFVYDEVGTQRKAQGADQAEATWQGWAAAFADSKGTITRALVSGNTVVLEVTWKGTHTGPLQTPKGPIAATGKSIEVRAINLFEIAGDKVSMQRQYFDMGTMLQQLGIGA